MSNKHIPERWRTEYELAGEINLSLGSVLARKIIEELGAAEAALAEAKSKYEQSFVRLRSDPYLELANVKAKAVLLLLALDTTDNKAITAAMIALTKAIGQNPDLGHQESVLYGEKP